MELPEVLASIRDNKPLNCYIFTGSEGAVQKVYINMLAERTGATIVRLDTVADAVRALSQRTLTDEKKLFVVFDDMAFTKAEKAWQTVFDRAAASKHILVLQYSKLDGRLKFSKRNKEIICVFDVLGPDIAASYVKKQLPDLSADLAVQLAEACGYDYGRILTETDKVNQYYRAIKKYSSDKPVMDGTDVNDAAVALLQNGVIYKPIGDITFAFTDAIMYRDTESTMQYLQQAITKGEPELVVLTVLYNNFRSALLVQGLGNDRSNAAKRTGLTPFQVKLASEKIGYYSLSEIQTNLRTIQEIEYGIKTGTFDTSMALAYAATTCLAAV